MEQSQSSYLIFRRVDGERSVLLCLTQVVDCGDLSEHRVCARHQTPQQNGDYLTLRTWTQTAKMVAPPISYLQKILLEIPVLQDFVGKQ